MLDLFLSQITDIFRIGLMAGLLYTARRTAAQTGTLVPVLAGIVFVAVIIPTTRGQAGWEAIAVGLVSNLAILAVLAAALAAVLRYRR